MTSLPQSDWHERNQARLAAEIAGLHDILTRYRDKAASPAAAEQSAAVTDGAEGMTTALDLISGAFGLSRFERLILLLCAAIEMDSRFPSLCASTQDDPQRPYPTFSLALAALPEAHWSALAPSAPLRQWRLIEVAPGNELTLSPLRIDERILHALTGLSYLDSRLRGLIEPIAVARDLPASQRVPAERLAATWSGQSAGFCVVHLAGEEPEAKHDVAAYACERLGLLLHRLRADDLPTAPADRDALAVLWMREAALGAGVLLIDCAESEISRGVAAFAESVASRLIFASRERPRLASRRIVSIEIGKASAAEQKVAWNAVLGPLAAKLNGHLDALVAQFTFATPAIQAVAAEALADQNTEDASDAAIERLWQICRIHTRGRLDDLAQRIEPAARWDDLVLPPEQLRLLHEIAAQVRSRATVYDSWGFAAKSARGLGISALFAGGSGTGKTMAAEVIAGELRLDLFRIDLSQVVNKYIGETEKNLRRVFDAAEQGGAVLLFDEADALFGKRSEVRDSHDRYANIEVSYLLQRMESYRGLAILTTNQKAALDQAFLRRLRFVVQFPFPDAGHRAEIWRRAFPATTPTQNLDPVRLARLNVPGGTIRNIALNAAFLAADAGQPVRMDHLLQSARTECAKLERPLSEAEIGGWA